MAKVLSKQDILSADDLARERVNVPEWDGDVFVRMMTGKEREIFEQSVMDANGEIDYTKSHDVFPRLVALTTTDEAGTLLFDRNGDIDALAAKGVRALHRVASVALRLNALTEDEKKEMAANFPEIPSGGSASSTRSRSAKHTKNTFRP